VRETMKKSIFILFIFILAFILLTGMAEGLNLNSVIFFFVNDDLIQFPTVQPEEIDGVFYVPIKNFAESLGAQVTWVSGSESVIIRKGDKQIIMKVRDNTVITESGAILPFAMYMKDGSTLMCNYIFPSEHLGYVISHIPGATIARIKDSSARLTDAQIYEKFLLEVKKQEEIEKQKQPKKTVYLTFDDGPNEYTGKILDILKKYDSKATFFMLNQNMKAYPDIVKRIVAEGHGAGLHGVSHDVKKVYASRESVLYEMNTANDTLESITGERTLLVRAPYGSRPYMSNEQYKALKSWGYKLWDWNIDSKDSQNSSVSPKEVINHTISQIPILSRPVVLFHDKKATLDYLPKILEYLKNQNYDIKALDSSMKPYNYIDY